MPQPNEVVDIWKYLEEWNRCISSRYQRDHLYRWGKFDNCNNQYNDIKIAFRAKMKDDSEEAKRLLETTYYRQNLGSDFRNSPTDGFIWELKKQPGWEVE
mmetsp:Transcript_5180/g.7643  ORF Transcript_5180/g.7643 Transcript_5180/m.7643 type:complete len:100 (+) Transcript_5180:98-397(+)